MPKKEDMLNINVYYSNIQHAIINKNKRCDFIDLDDIIDRCFTDLLDE